MERIKVRCPSCGNKMDIDSKVIAFRCSKCGNKIDLDDDPVKNDLTGDQVISIIDKYADVKKEKIRHGVVWKPEEIIELILVIFCIGAFVFLITRF